MVCNFYSSVFLGASFPESWGPGLGLMGGCLDGREGGLWLPELTALNSVWSAYGLQGGLRGRAEGACFPTGHPE